MIMPAPRLEILTFHRLVPEGDSYFIPPMAISATTFTRLLQSLKRHYQVLPLNEAIRAFRNGGLRRATVALTFDDGYSDNFHLARGVLLEEGLSATFFIPVGPIQEGTVYWWDWLFHIARYRSRDFIAFLGQWRQRLGLDSLQSSTESTDAGDICRFCRKLVQVLNGVGNTVRGSFFGRLEAQFGAYDGPGLLMSMDDVRTLVRDGFEVGSHSVNHIPLTDLTLAEARAEMRDSKALLEKALGGCVEGFSYPRGAYSPEIAGAARDAGYAYAVTTRYGSNIARTGLHELARRNMSDYQGLRSGFPVLMHRLEISGRLDCLLAARR